MKILHVTDFLPGLHSTAGGAEFATLRIIEQQRKLGHEVATVTTRCNYKPPKEFEKNIELPITDRIWPKFFFAIKQLFFPIDLISQIKFKKILDKVQPDIVHFHNLHFLGINLIKIANKKGYKTCLSIYDYWLFCPGFMLYTNKKEVCERGHGAYCSSCIGTTHFSQITAIKNFLFSFRKPIWEHYLSFNNEFLCLSNASKKLLVKHGINKNKISVHPLYLWEEAGTIDPINKIVDGKISYIGWIDERKGAHIAILAFSKIADNYPEAVLEIWGPESKTPYGEYVSKLIDKQVHKDRILLKGKADRKRILSVFEESNCIIIPEQWENMSPVILTEAMMAGKCVVASHIGGLPEFIDHEKDGFLAKRNDPNEFAYYLDFILSHPKEIKSMGLSAREKIKKKLSLNNINTNLINTYTKLVGNK